MEKPPKVKASPNGFEKITIRLFSVFVCFCSDHRSQTYSKQNDRFSTQYVNLHSGPVFIIDMLAVLLGFGTEFFFTSV